MLGPEILLDRFGYKGPVILVEQANDCLLALFILLNIN